MQRLQCCLFCPDILCLKNKNMRTLKSHHYPCQNILYWRSMHNRQDMSLTLRMQNSRQVFQLNKRQYLETWYLTKGTNAINKNTCINFPHVHSPVLASFFFFILCCTSGARTGLTHFLQSEEFLISSFPKFQLVCFHCQFQVSLTEEGL